MTLEEIARIRLEIDDASAKGSLDSLKELSKEINNELKLMELAGEKGSEGWKELKNAARDVKEEMNAIKHSIDINDASITELNESLRYWQKIAKDAKEGTEEWIEAGTKVNQIKDRIADVNHEMSLLGREVEEQGKEGGLWSNMKSQALAVFTGTGLFELAKSAGEAIFEFGKEIFETTAKFEKYEAVLKVALGTQEAASKAMEDIKEQAKVTPFTVDELTESYVKYVNRGLQPTMVEMTKMGDIAASQGKSFDQLTEAILDATTGEFERLKEFGIQATKANGEVELSFKGVTTVVKEQPDAIEKALLAFGELEGVQGSMAAMSQTLEGRVSNLSDNFDSLKLILGDVLKPVFSAIIDVMSFGVDVVKDLFSGSSELSPVFSAIAEGMSSAYESAKSLFESYIDGAKDSGALSFVLETLIFSIKSTTTAFLLGLTAVQAFWDGLNIVINKGKELANFFGAEFEINPAANFDTLQQNAEKNFANIEKMWQGTNDNNVKTTEQSNVKQVSSHEKTQSAMTLAEQKERDKRDKAKAAADKKVQAQEEKDRVAKEKSEADLNKKIEEMRIKSISDELTRKKAEINLKFDLEQASIKKSLASQATKDKAITALAKSREAEITKVENEARVKKENEDKKQRDKTLAEDKKLREATLKAEKALFDAEFTAEVSKAKNVLDLTKSNSQAQWNAKKALLETEWRYKQQQLKNEAEAEKARIAESISDTEQRRIALENIDAALKAKLSSEEKKFQDDKTKLNDEQNKAREENNKKFFEALNAAMTGDFNSFLKFLKDKVKSDESANLKRLQDFAQKTQQISDAALTGINTLKQLNQQFLESQLSKITNEKNAQLASWQKQYDSGKISKEKFEAERDRINKDASDKELKVRKDAFEREKKMNIAAAAINTAQAALKSFAMFGWPIGAIMAALAAVAGGLQIAAIKRQQFSGRDGGIFRNAGVAQGGLHGSSYGSGGIAMYDRATGREVGEIEGGEPVMVLSRNTYGNNKQVIDKLLHSSLHRNGAPITLKNGGVFRLSSQRMYEDGGVVNSGVNVDNMMNENKKSQETMEKTRDNTGKTAENVNALGRILQNVRQNGKMNDDNNSRSVQNLLFQQVAVLKQIERNIKEERDVLREILKVFIEKSDDLYKLNEDSQQKMYSILGKYMSLYLTTTNGNHKEVIALLKQEILMSESEYKVLMKILEKPDGANNILNAIGKINANLIKAKM